MTGQGSRISSSLCSFVLVLLLSVLPGALWASEKPKPAGSGSRSPSEDESLEQQLKDYLGIPYRRGGACLKGMDCSGFSSFVYSNMFGVDLPHNAAKQYGLSFLEPVPQEDLQPGDLLFFSRRKRIDHVGIYLGDGKFIHASGKKRKITISNFDSPYFQRAFVGAKRLAAGIRTGDAGEYETETSVDFVFEERDRIRLFFSGMTGLPADGFAGYPEDAFLSDPYREGPDRPFFFEVEYRHVILDHAWNVTLSALWERSYLDSDTHPLFAAGRSPKPTFFAEDPYSISRSGFRVASDLGILPWLRVTPSVTYYDYEDDSAVASAFPGVLGLEATLSPRSARYDLAMALRYGDTGSALLGRSDLLETSKALGLSFAFRYHLTDLLHLSLLGQHSIREDIPASSREPSVAGIRTYHDILFTFDLSY